MKERSPFLFSSRPFVFPFKFYFSLSLSLVFPYTRTAPYTGVVRRVGKEGAPNGGW